MASQAEQTAFGPIVIAAIEQTYPRSQRLVSDRLAAGMLPWAFRLVVRACGWTRVRRALIQASEGKAPGIWAGVCARKRYIDHRVELAVADGVQQIVVLGAGLDTLGARLVTDSPALRVYELDLPGNIAVKRARLEATSGAVPEALTLVAVDFETAQLDGALAAAGFDASRAAVFVWEGVTQYLTEPGARATMEFLADAAPGSRLLFTYIRRDFIDGHDFHGSAALHQDLVVRRGAWRFGLSPSDVDTFVRAYGWRATDLPEPADLAERYVAPTGRDLAISEIERCVEARKGEAPAGEV